MLFSKGKPTKVSMIYEALVKIKLKLLALGLGIQCWIICLKLYYSVRAQGGKTWQNQSWICVPCPQVLGLGNTPHQR